MADQPEYNDAQPQQAPQVQPQQPPEKEKEHPEVYSWLSRIEHSKAVRGKVAAQYDWKAIVDEFHGKFDWARWGLTDIYVPPLNLIFAYIQTEVPGLAFRDPHIKVNPKTEHAIASAKILEKGLNYIWRHQRLKRENTKNVQDALLVGHSWFKTGYLGAFELVEEGDGNTHEFISSEEFFGYRVPWEQIIFSPDSIDPPYDTPWIVHEVWLLYDDVRENPNFKNTQYVQAATRKKTDINITGTLNTVEQLYDPEQKYVCVYEVWDKRSKTKFVITPGCGYYLQDPQPWPYGMRGFPFSYLCFNPSPLQPYGIPDCYTFRPQVLELMKIYAMMLDHLKRFNRQYLVKRGALTEDGKAQLSQGITGAMVEVEDPTAVVVLQYPPIQQDVYAIERLLKEILINVSGQSPQERGATQQTSTRTFRELAQIQRGAENRRSRKVDVFEDFVEDISGNLIVLLQKFADVPFYVRLTGDDFQEIQDVLAARPSAQQQGAITGPQGFTFTKDDIQGDFDIEVVAGSTVPLDRPNTMATLESIIPELPQLGIMPGGPVAAAIGNILAENLGMPEIQKAIKAEGQMKQQMQQQQDQQNSEASQMAAAQAAAKLKIEAEKVGIKQNQILADIVKHKTPPAQAPKEPADE